MTTPSGGFWMSMRLAVTKAELKTSSRNSHSCNDASKGMLKGKPLKMFWKSRHIVWIRDRPATRFKTNIIFLLSCLPKVLRKLEYRRSDVNSPAIKCKLRVTIHRPFARFYRLATHKITFSTMPARKNRRGGLGGGGRGEGRGNSWPVNWLSYSSASVSFQNLPHHNKFTLLVESIYNVTN